MCGLGTMCDTSVGCKRMRCDAGVMWCSAGEKKRERVEGERDKRGRHIIHKKNGKGSSYLYEFPNFLSAGKSDL